MAKRIIILERDGPRNFRAALWAAVPAARQAFYADSNKVSAFNGADAGELAALKTGAVVERVNTYNYPAAMSVAQIQTALEVIWETFQSEITGRNLWAQYGRFWDGTTWTAGGVS